MHFITFSAFNGFFLIFFETLFFMTGRTLKAVFILIDFILYVTDVNILCKNFNM